jgi:hypothetical protein
MTMSRQSIPVCVKQKATDSSFSGSVEWDWGAARWVHWPVATAGGRPLMATQYRWRPCPSALDHAARFPMQKHLVPLLLSVQLQGTLH